MTHPLRSPLPRCLSVVAGVVLAASLPAAQAQYRVVGPDGKVTYTDRPPAQGRAVTGTAVGTPESPAPALAALPADLRGAATRYPATLYTTQNCGPCDAARQYLRTRGIPHAERVVSDGDGEALQRLTGARELPTLTLGSQVLRGYSADTWASYLDAASYPRQSRLPGNYVSPPPTPLTPAPTPAGTPAAATPAPAPAVTAPPPAPGGIRF